MTTHLTHSHFFISSHNFIPIFSPEPHVSHFRRLPRRRSFLAAVCASSLDKTSVARRKPAKTNVDLCTDLREVIAELGLPEGRVPSLKELSQHGRQDLANVVRRRGYKLVKELLAASQEIKVSDSDAEESLTEDDELTDENGKELTEYMLSPHEDLLSHVEESLAEDDANKEEGEVKGPDENGKEVTEYMLSPLEDMLGDVEESLTEENANKEEDELAGPDENGKEVTEYTLSPHDDVLGDGSTKLSLQEKVAKFIQTGELEEIEGCEEPISQVLSESDSVNVENGSILTSQLVNSTSQSSDQVSSDEAANTDKDFEPEIITKEDQAEINHIKLMLHNKELELSQLKEQIEKNKEALSELQAKAEIEISKAHKLLLDKDAELLTAEESLSGLKQVQLEYWGEGETVLVAGSFNGWHHGVTLDPQPSSNITDPDELRNPKLWRSMLWLYPGIYEIKFIVDGKWVVDPMKEVVDRGSIHNNVLRVDR